MFCHEEKKRSESFHLYIFVYQYCNRKRDNTLRRYHSPKNPLFFNRIVFYISLEEWKLSTLHQPTTFLTASNEIGNLVPRVFTRPMRRPSKDPGYEVAQCDPGYEVALYARSTVEIWMLFVDFYLFFPVFLSSLNRVSCLLSAVSFNSFHLWMLLSHFHICEWSASPKPVLFWNYRYHFPLFMDTACACTTSPLHRDLLGKLRLRNVPALSINSEESTNFHK